MTTQALPEGKAYACPKCSKPMHKLESFACWWCPEPCGWVYDSWYDGAPQVIDAPTKAHLNFTSRAKRWLASLLRG